jgi:hypothetical protein
MKKEVIAIIAVAAIHFTVSQTILAQQIMLDLPKFPTIGNPYTEIDGSWEAIAEDRISDTNERRRIEPTWRTAFFGNPLTEFGVQ